MHTHGSQAMLVGRDHTWCATKEAQCKIIVYILIAHTNSSPLSRAETDGVHVEGKDGGEVTTVIHLH